VSFAISFSFFVVLPFALAPVPVVTATGWLLLARVAGAASPQWLDITFHRKLLPWEFTVVATM
jgi:hypothetical protein